MKEEGAVMAGKKIPKKVNRRAARFGRPSGRNLFCKRADLDSEADVESLFLDRLIVKLRYPDNRVKRKDSLDKIKVSRGRRKETFRPDYVLLGRQRRPAVVIDAKAPGEKPADYHYQVAGYAFGLNQRFNGVNPVKFTVVSNGGPHPRLPVGQRGATAAPQLQRLRGGQPQVRRGTLPALLRCV